MKYIEILKKYVLRRYLKDSEKKSYKKEIQNEVYSSNYKY